MQVKRRRRGLENRFRVLITGCLTSFRRIGRGPKTISAASRYATQLGEGAKYYQYNPQEATRLLADAGFPKGFKTQIHATGGYGRDLLDALQLIQQYLKT